MTRRLKGKWCGFAIRRVGGTAPSWSQSATTSFGLYDMSEGVHEWMQLTITTTILSATHRAQSAGRPLRVSRRASRGGSGAIQNQVRPLARGRGELASRLALSYSDYVFRVALTIQTVK